MCIHAGRPALTHVQECYSLHVSSVAASESFPITFTSRRENKIHPCLWCGRRKSNGKPTKAIDQYQLNGNENGTDRHMEPRRGARGADCVNIKLDTW
ncbi:rCG61100, partial [Rattus norvegicus]